jgi:Dolichyl-phosphate-mannose-protein mannosyltransferase
VIRRVGLVALIGVSLAAKLAIAHSAQGTVQGADGVWYHQQAVYVLQHPNALDPGWFSRLYSPIGYPAFVATIYAIVGPHAGAVYAAQAILATLMAILLYPIGSRLLNARTGLLAMVIALLSPAWWFAVSLMGYELLLGFLLVASLAALVTVPNRWSLGLAILSGALLGLGVLTQSKVILLLLPWLVYAYRMAGKKVALSLLLACLVPTLIWTGRNLVVFHEFVPGSTNLGVTLWTGNNPAATGGYITPPFVDGIDQALKPSAPVLAADRLYTKAALNFMLHNAPRVETLMFLKTERLFLPLYPPNLAGNQQQHQIEQLTGGRLAPYMDLIGHGGNVAANLLVAFFVGAWLVARPRPWRAPWLLVAALALFVAAHLPLIAEPRYRFSILPIMELMEAAVLVAVGSRLFLVWETARAETTARTSRPGVDPSAARE